LQPFDPGIGLALGIGDIGKSAGVFEHEAAQRIDIIRQVRFEKHELVESVDEGTRQGGSHRMDT